MTQATSTEDAVLEQLYELGYQSDHYDVGNIVGDVDNGARILSDFTDFEDYNKRTIVVNSIICGQFTQAKEQAERYGLNYELVKYQVKGE